MTSAKTLAPKALQSIMAPVSQHLSPAINPDEYIHSSLIHEVYLHNDLKTDFPKFWGRTGIAQEGFGHFLQRIKDLTLDLNHESLNNLNHNESIETFIGPVLEALGWLDRRSETVANKIINIMTKSGDEVSIRPSLLAFETKSDQSHFQTYFNSEKKIDKSLNLVPIATAYFGAWSELRSGKFDRTKEQITKFGDVFSALGCDEQCFNYLELLGREWGISTDGHTWRLIKKSAFTVDHKKYFEFSLYPFIQALRTAKPAEEDSLIEIAKYFYWFFSKESILGSAPSNVSATFERSKQQYADNFEDDMRGRFVAAMSIAVNSLWKSALKKELDVELGLIQDLAESIIYNALFIRSCESQRVLPLHQNYMPVSLHNLLNKLKSFRPTENDFSEATKLRLTSLCKKPLTEDGPEIFDYLINLFELTNDSTKKSQTLGFAIEGFSENVFSAREWQMLKKMKIDNISLSKILSTLFFIDEDTQVPFKVLTPQQFGSIFESFLEFKLQKVASTQYLVSRKRNDKLDVLWIERPKASDEVLYIAKRGSLYFRPDNIERKISGSYFTPDHVVDLIVKETLGPIVRAKTADEILKIRVCDPAMGSGHFLISALRYLTSEYLKKKRDTSESMSSIKHRVLHECIFGVDINPRAVKLGKLALWLETSEAGKALEHLDDQIRCSNSLIDDSLWKREWRFIENGIDAVIGNPPYIGERKNKIVFEPVQKSAFARYYLGRMDYFYFFFHLALDIVKQGGSIGFITTNYFPTADGARMLREDMKKRSTVLRLLNFNEYKIFDSAGGQHNMITILKKGCNPAEEARTSISNGSGHMTPEIGRSVFDGSDPNTEYHQIPQVNLWESEECYLRVSGSVDFAGSKTQSVLSKMANAKNHVLLGEICNTSIGMETSADKIYVIANDSIKSIIEDKAERKYFKPWFKNSEIGQYFCKTRSDSSVIFTHEQNLEIIKQKGIGKYLKSHQKDLQSRKGANLRGAFKRGNWWVLNTPRLEMNFDREKLVTPYRTKTPKFSYNDVPWYASRDVYFITSRDSNFALKYILALLNSKLYFLWLYTKGKRKGEMMEMYSKPLSEIPIKKINQAEQMQFVSKVDSIMNLLNDENGTIDSFKQSKIKQLKNEIDQMVYNLFGLTSMEAQLVEEFAAKKESEERKTDAKSDNVKKSA
jgi:type I restriction-modification system DNA methylase subunit